MKKIWKMFLAVSLSLCMALDMPLRLPAFSPAAYGTRFSGLGCNIVADADDAQRGGYTSLAWWTDVVSANPSLQ